MENLESVGACFTVDEDLLNFKLEGEEQQDVSILKGGSASCSSLNTPPFGRPLSEMVEEEELEWLSNKEAFPAVETCFGILDLNPVWVVDLKLPTNHPVGARTKGSRRPGFRSKKQIGIRRCMHCEAENTPQWRAGPMGPKTLCNACGVRYKSGRLLPEYRPANSPTFSNLLHSNSHRKVLQMRSQPQPRPGVC